MLVGKVTADEALLLKSSRSVETYEEFCLSLIPKEYRHITAIVDNQKYVCALQLRRSNGLSWERKREFLNQVMKNLRITGYLDEIVEVSSLIGFADLKRIRAMKEAKNANKQRYNR